MFFLFSREKKSKKHIVFFLTWNNSSNIQLVGLLLYFWAVTWSALSHLPFTLYIDLQWIKSHQKKRGLEYTHTHTKSTQSYGHSCEVQEHFFLTWQFVLCSHIENETKQKIVASDSITCDMHMVYLSICIFYYCYRISTKALPFVMQTDSIKWALFLCKIILCRMMICYGAYLFGLKYAKHRLNHCHFHNIFNL